MTLPATFGCISSSSFRKTADKKQVVLGYFPSRPEQ
jgi:hypothetical protein